MKIRHFCRYYFGILLFILLIASLVGCGPDQKSDTFFSSTQVTTVQSTAPDKSDTTTEVSTTEVQTTEVPTPTAPTPQIQASYEISSGETPFTNGRAIVTFYDGSLCYGMMEENGYLLWKEEVPSNSDGWSNVALCTDFIDDGFIVLYMRDWDDQYRNGVIIIDNQGNLIFDYREQQENAKYWYMGYFNNTFLLLENYSDFSTSDQYTFLEIGTDGKVRQQLKIDGNPKGEYCKDCGQGILAGCLNYESRCVWIYNMNSHAYIYLYPRVCSVYADDNEKALIQDDNHYYYCTPFRYLNDTQSFESLLEGDGLAQYAIGISSRMVCGIHNGLINVVEPDWDNTKHPGIYTIDGKLINAYPSNWNITRGYFSDSGYVFVFLRGADKKEYFAVVNSKGEIVVEPTIYGDQYNPSEQYKDALNKFGSDEKMEKIRTKYHQYSNDGWQGYHYHREDDSQIFTVYEVSNLSELLEYNLSLDNDSSQNSENKEYVFIKDFSIIGTWQNNGSHTFGQAQSGAIIVFDGSHCNYFSPSDTYAFYVEGEDYRLDCTSPLGETVSFTVRIIDENHIDIFYGQNNVELTRIVQ